MTEDEKATQLSRMLFNADSLSKAILDHYSQSMAKLLDISEEDVKTAVVMLANDKFNETKKKFNQ